MGRSVAIPVAVAAAVVATSLPRTASADPITVRDVVTYSALGLGAIAIGVGIGETAHATSLDSQNETDRQQVPVTVINVCNSDSAAAQAACKSQNDSSSAWTAAWVAYGTGLALVGAGVVLLLTKPHAATTTGQVDATPAVSAHTAGLQLRLAF